VIEVDPLKSGQASRAVFRNRFTSNLGFHSSPSGRGSAGLLTAALQPHAASAPGPGTGPRGRPAPHEPADDSPVSMPGSAHEFHAHDPGISRAVTPTLSGPASRTRAPEARPAAWARRGARSGVALGRRRVLAELAPRFGRSTPSRPVRSTAGRRKSKRGPLRQPGGTVANALPDNAKGPLTRTVSGPLDGCPAALEPATFGSGVVTFRWREE
jgi:hypothetical protein